MKNNILGGLVIFMVVLTCLLMLDDISNTQDQPSIQEAAQVDQLEQQTDLAIPSFDFGIIFTSINGVCCSCTSPCLYWCGYSSLFIWNYDYSSTIR